MDLFLDVLQRVQEEGVQFGALLDEDLCELSHLTHFLGLVV